MNFETKMLENAVNTLGTIIQKPQSTTSEKSEQLWSSFLSHLVCMKPHLAAANSVTEETKSCVCCWQAPSSWQDSHTGLLQGPAPPQTPGVCQCSSTSRVLLMCFFWSISTPTALPASDGVTQ